MIKKYLALLCAAAMLCTMGVGLAEQNEFGWEKPAETISFTSFIASDNWTLLEEQKTGIANMQKYLLDNFNVEFNIETTDGDAEEALNLMLASGDYPDIIRGASTAARQKFVSQGKAVKLNDYIANSPNLSARLSDYIGMYADENGDYYYLPSYFGNLMDLPDYSAHIRYDEWMEIGSPKISTPQDYFNAIKAIYDLHPTTDDGEQRYTLGLYKQGLPEYISGYWGLQQGWKVNDDNTLTYWAFTDEGKEMAKFFNEWWNTGTMDPDSFTNEWNDLRTKISQKRIIGMIGGWWIGYNAGHEIWSLTDDNWNENMRFIQVGFKSENAENAYVTMKNNMGSAWTIITDKALNPEGIMKWIDFTMTDPGAALTNWGMPGEVQSYKNPDTTKTIWNITSPTEWAIDPVAKEELIAETWDYNEEGIFGTSSGCFQLSVYQGRWADGESCCWLNQMWYSENKWKQIMFDNMAGTIFDGTALLAYGNMDEDVTMAKTAVEDAWKQYYPLVCMAEDEDTFEAAWTALQDALNMAGIDTWTNFRTERYQANLAAMQ